jgi:hypothetical protein
MNVTHEMRNQSLFNAGRALTFPSDEHGRVAMESLSDRARASYLFAQAAVGRGYAHPVVRSSTQH